MLLGDLTDTFSVKRNMTMHRRRYVASLLAEDKKKKEMGSSLCKERRRFPEFNVRLLIQPRVYTQNRARDILTFELASGFAKKRKKKE